jgi:ATP-dependent Zn protease
MDQLKLKIARHETGHAVMALICLHNVQKVSLKEMDSPIGKDKFLGFTKVDRVDKNATFTINEADRKVMIALGGYASEILFYDVIGIGGDGADDLTRAVNIVEDMLQVEDFKKLVSKLPEPSPGELKSVKNPLIRNFIDYKFDQAVNALTPLKHVIHSIAEELYKKEELSGDEVTALFDSLAMPN